MMAVEEHRMNSILPEPLESPAIPLTHAGTTPETFGFRRLIAAVFSFPVFLCFALIGLMAFTIRNRFDDPDLWWHLRTGQIVWTTHSIPTTEFLSHTAAGHLWIPHEWLSELSLYGAYRLNGYPGLMFWFLISASLLVVLLYGLSWLYSGNAKVSFLGGLMGWYFGSIGLTVRPLVLGHLLLVVELLLLELGRTRDARWFWGLPVVFAIWVNCHASYAFGIFVLLVTVACAYCKLSIGPIVSTKWRPATGKTLALAAIASVIALFCNPMGWRLITYPLNTVFLQHNELLSYVDEWLPLPFLDARAAGLLLIMGGIGLVAAGGATIRLEEFILVSIRVRDHGGSSGLPPAFELLGRIRSEARPTSCERGVHLDCYRSRLRFFSNPIRTCVSSTQVEPCRRGRVCPQSAFIGSNVE
jgi:hypothetical protein